MTFNVPMPALTSYLKILLHLFVVQHVISLLGLLPIHSPQASVRCPIVSTTASLSCWSRFGLDNRHNSPGITLNSDKEDTNCSVTERERKWRIQNNPIWFSWGVHAFFLPLLEMQADSVLVITVAILQAAGLCAK